LFIGAVYIVGVLTFVNLVFGLVIEQTDRGFNRKERKEYKKQNARLSKIVFKSWNVRSL